MRSALVTIFLACTCCTTTAGRAESITTDPSKYTQAVKALRPGDILILAPGRYESGLDIHNLIGTPELPIEIRGSGQGDVVLSARPGRNTISIVDSAHVLVRRLALDGRGAQVDAVKCEGHAGWSHHITLENLVISGFDNDQQDVGISTKCPAWGWVIRGNRIIGAGTGIYLGNSDGGAPFVDGVIENNLVLDTAGYNLQIKHQRERPKLPGMPTKQSNTIIRYNVFGKARNAATGELARPNVLLGHWPLTGSGENDLYLVYGNLFYDNPSEALFQGEGNLALYDNLLVNPNGDAVRVQPHRHLPRAIRVFDNTIVARDAGVFLTGGEPGHERRVEGNAIFAREPLHGVDGDENFTASYLEASRRLRAPFALLDELDLTPAGSALRRAQRPDPVLRRLPGADRDYTGRPRVDAFFGACAPRIAGRPSRACR